MQNDLSAVITGASAGIGAAFASALHQRGMKVHLIARRGDRLHAQCEEFNRRRPGSATFAVADLANSADRLRIAEALRSMTVDLLVNNAGRGSFGPLETLPLNEEITMVELNCLSYLILAHAVVPQMKQRRSGAIINVSSVAAFQPLPYMSTYAGTKGFDFLFSLGLRAELSSSGVKVLAVCPGPTATEFGGVARVPGTVAGGPRDTAELVVEKSLAALDKNRALVVPGVRASGLALLSHLLPAGITSRVLERLLRKALPKNLQ